jgi:hypothetical protein
MPDYAKRETVNRISTGTWFMNDPIANNHHYDTATWTADRTGYVHMSLDFAVPVGTGETWGQVLFIVNGVIAVGHGSASNVFGDNAVIPVKQGDVVFMKWVTGLGTQLSPRNIFCYFIPPVFVEKQSPVVVVEPNGSYSTEEIKTAQTWIDGKPIYRKSFNFGTKTFAANSKGSILDNAFPANYVETVVKQSFSATDGYSNLTGTPSWTDRVDESGFTFFLSMSNSIQHRTKTASTLTNLIFTIEYTKTTD